MPHYICFSAGAKIGHWLSLPRCKLLTLHGPSFSLFLADQGAPEPPLYNFQYERVAKSPPLSHLLPRTAPAVALDFMLSPIAKLVCRLLPECKTPSNSS